MTAALFDRCAYTRDQTPMLFYLEKYVLLIRDIKKSTKKHVLWAENVHCMGEDNTCIYNSGLKTSWKTSTWKTEKKIGGSELDKTGSG
jgi:hypothetical protein